MKVLRRPRPARLLVPALFALTPFLSEAAPAGLSPPAGLSGIGDSITQAFAANNSYGDKPEYSFAQGTNATVNSVYSRYRAAGHNIPSRFVSVSGAEMVGGGDNAPAQASRICAMAQKPNRVLIELGGNDVCNRTRNSGSDPTPPMYSVTTYRNSLKAALDQLATCLPTGSLVHVLSMPRVDYLYEAGRQKSFWCPTVWSLAGICRFVTGEGDASRRAKIGQRVNEYNDGILAEVRAADMKAAGRVRFTSDWRGSGMTNSSVGTYRFGSGDIDSFDCFHPYYATGHRKLACTAWESSEGGGNVAACLGS